MTKTMTAFPDPYMPTIVTGNEYGLPKTDSDMTYLEEKNIDEAIHQKIWKRDKYETNVHKIYNIIVGKTNEQL